MPHSVVIRTRGHSYVIECLPRQPSLRFVSSLVIGSADCKRMYPTVMLVYLPVLIPRTCHNMIYVIRCARLCSFIYLSTLVAVYYTWTLSKVFTYLLHLQICNTVFLVRHQYCQNNFYFPI